MEYLQDPLSAGAVGTFDYDVEADRWTWSEELYERRGLDGTSDRPSLDLWLVRVVEEDRLGLKSALVEAIQKPGPFSARFRIETPGQGVRSVLLVGRSTGSGSGGGSLHGFAVDLTAPLDAYAGDAVAASAEHRAAIEQVKGALMLEYRLTEDEAFAVLRKGSNDLNEKLAHLAARIAEHLAEPDTAAGGSPLAVVEKYLRP